jgi:hypothetical protein
LATRTVWWWCWRANNGVLDRLEQVRTAEAGTVTLVEQGATMAAGALRMIEKATIVQK